MYSRVVLVFLIYLTGLYGLGLPVDETKKSDVAVPNDDGKIANRSLITISSAAPIEYDSKVNTTQPDSLEISPRILNPQNETDSPGIASRIGLGIEEPIVSPDTFNAPNGFIPSFLKTFRRKRNLVV